MQGENSAEVIAGAFFCSRKRIGCTVSLTRLLAEKAITYHLSPATSIEGAVHLAETIRSRVEGLQIPNEKSLPAKVLTLSLRVASLEECHVNSSGELIKYADIVLCRAKDQDRNRGVVFEPSFSRTVDRILPMLLSVQK